MCKYIHEKFGYGAKGFFSDTTSHVHHFDQAMRGCVIRNDGESDLKVTILNESFIVKPKEQFEEFFEPFSAIEIDTLGQAVPYRAYGRC